MEKIQKKIKQRNKANNKKNFNLSQIPPKKRMEKKVNNKRKRQGGFTSSKAMQNSATITCTVVRDPNSETFRRFVVVSYPSKGIDSEMFGPFETVQDCVHAALEYVKPLFDESTENVYVTPVSGSTQRYPVVGGQIQHV